MVRKLLGVPQAGSSGPRAGARQRCASSLVIALTERLGINGRSHVRALNVGRSFGAGRLLQVG